MAKVTLDLKRANVQICNSEWGNIEGDISKQEDLQFELQSIRDSITNNEYDDTEIKEALANKVDKEDGKQLSTNDFTDEYKQKIDSIGETFTNVYVEGETLVIG